MPKDDIMYVSREAFFSSLSKSYSVKEVEEDDLDNSKFRNSKADKDI